MAKKKKGQSIGQSIGGIVVGIEQQIFKTTPPVSELIASAAPLAPVAASGGGTMTVGLPGDPVAAGALDLGAAGVSVSIDLANGGRIASLIVDGRQLLKTEGFGQMSWGSFPMAPYAGRIRDATFTFEGRTIPLPPTMPPHAIHGTVLDRPWQVIDETTIETGFGPDWPFTGRAVQRFTLTEDALTCRLEVHADEPMPAYVGWHPWFVRRLPGVADALELDLDAGRMYVRDEAGITTERLVEPTGGPWDDCFTDLRHPPVLRWPGFLELTIESDCPDWVVFTEPDDALCVEPQTAPPDALNHSPRVVLPGEPLIAETTWRWRSLAG